MGDSLTNADSSRWVYTMLVVVLGLVLCQDARAFYNPSTGRWLSRDPIGETGFELIRGDEVMVNPQKVEGNLVAFVSNATLDRFDYLGLNPNIAPGTRISVSIQGGGKATITVGNHLTPEEQTTARRALCLVRKLLGAPTFIPPFSDTYWAALSGAPSDGFTYDGSIFISSSAKPSCSLSSVAVFGALLAHEADHYYTGSTDGHPNDPEHRINNPALDGMRKALSEVMCGCCHGQWQLENLLGKYACDCGLAPCKPKPCPQSK